MSAACTAPPLSRLGDPCGGLHDAVRIGPLGEVIDAGQLDVFFCVPDRRSGRMRPSAAIISRHCAV